MASVLVIERADPGPIAMALAPLFDKGPHDDEAQTTVAGDMQSCADTETALSWVVSHIKKGLTDLVVIVDIGGGIESRLHLIDQLKHMPLPIPIVLVTDHEAHLDERIRALGFDIVLDRSEMEPLCHLKRSHPATVDLCHYAFVWPIMPDGETLDGMTLLDIMRDIIECQCVEKRTQAS